MAAALSSDEQEPSKMRVGEFELRGVLGRGGSGTVYAAVDGAGREIALKVLGADLSLSDHERGRFIDEASRMRRVNHPGLVAILGSGDLPDGRPYIAMPRLRGETLHARLARGRLSVDEALAIFDPLAQALGALHTAGFLHRDIKPSNVFLVGGAGTVAPVLLDFGVARDVSDAAGTTTVAGRVRGTPAYMAPERLFGTGANVRSDVYELAVTLYQMLVGRRPWDRDHDAESRLNPRTPEDAGVRLPGDLSTCLLRALSTRPELRPDGPLVLAAEMRESVIRPDRSERATVTMNVATAPSSAPVADVRVEASRGRSRPRAAPVAIAASVSLLALAGFVVAGVARQGPSASTPVSPASTAAIEALAATTPPSIAPSLPPAPPVANAALTAATPVRKTSPPHRLASPGVDTVASPTTAPPQPPPASAEHYYSYRK